MYVWFSLGNAWFLDPYSQMWIFYMPGRLNQAHLKCFQSHSSISWIQVKFSTTPLPLCLSSMELWQSWVVCEILLEGDVKSWVCSWHAICNWSAMSSQNPTLCFSAYTVFTKPTKTFGICRYQFILPLWTVYINVITLLIDKLRIEERNVVK